MGKLYLMSLYSTMLRIGTCGTLFKGRVLVPCYNRPRSKIILEQEASEVYVNPLPIDSNKIAFSQVGARGGSLSQIWNISSQTLGAIFVDVNVDVLYISSLLEELDLPTIGIFQSEGQPRTQVHNGS